MKTKKTLIWWLGLFISLATALATYLSSCSTQTRLSIVADTIEKPNITFSDSTKFSNPLNR